MSGKDQRPPKGDAPDREAASKRNQGRGDASGEELGLLGLSDIKLLRLGWPSATFDEWKRAFVTVLTAMYGSLARSLAPGSTEYYRPKLAPYADFVQVRLSEMRPSPRASQSSSNSRTRSVAATDAATDDPDDELMDYIKDNYRDLMKENLRDIAAMERLREKMFSTIWMRMSRESQERVKMTARWTKVVTGDDPLELWLAIQESHSMYISGNTVYDTNQAWTAWYNLRHGASQGLPQFREAFDAAFAEIASRVPEDRLPKDGERAIQFITSLDPTRFAELQLNYRNKLQAYPATLSAAYKVASEWVIMPRGTLSSQSSKASHAAFHIQTAASAYVANGKDKDKTKSDKGKQKDKQKKNPQDKKKPKFEKKEGSDKTRDNVCHACKQQGHYARECPLFKKFLESLGGHERSYRTVTNDDDGEANDSESVDPDGMLEDFAKRFDTKHVSFVIRGEEDITVAHDTTTTTQPGGYHAKQDSSESTTMTTSTLKSNMSSTVLLDNQATRGVFGNCNLLKNIKRTSKVITFSGVGGSKRTNLIGYFDPLDMWVSYIPNLGFNVLSFSEVENKHTIKYLPREAFVVETDDNSHRFTKERSGLWSCCFTDSLPTHVVAVQTVQENERRFSKRDVEAAKAARELSKRLGYPAKADLQRMLTQGVLNNSPVSARDVERAHEIYGPEVAVQKGKTRLGKPTAVPTVPLPKYVFVELDMFVDIMHVEGERFLLSVTLPLGLLMVAPIADKTIGTLRAVLNTQLREYKGREFMVNTLWCDNEGAIAALRGDLQEAGIRLETASANKHVPAIEVRIKIVKERCRAILNTLPFLLPRSKLKNLVNYAVSRINLVPTPTLRRDGVSPRESFMGRRADTKIDARIAFGTYVQVHTFAEPVNSMAPRTEAAIALEPTGNANGSVYFWTPRSNKILVRSEWPGGELPMPEDLILFINKIATSEGAVSKKPKFRVGNHEVVDVPVHVAPPQVRMPLRRVLNDNVPPGTGQASAEDVLPRRDTRGDTPVESDDATPPVSHDDKVVDGRPPSEPPPSQQCLHMSVKESIKRHGDVANEAIRGEITQMVSQGVFEPVPRGSLTRDERAKIIRSHMFLTAKYDADGSFMKMKARLVAGGNTQDRSVYDTITSPTASLAAVFMVAAMAAHEGRKICVVDITGAYLNASMGDTVVHMRLDSHVSQCLRNLDPKFKGCESDDGSMTVKLNKALYGCIQSARLWFETLTRALKEEYGMVSNPYDTCVLNKGEELTIVIYVDDLLIAATTAEVIEDVTKFLEMKFRTITKKEGDEVSYLGMVFSFKTSTVIITMPKYVSDVLDSCHVTDSVATPATNALYDVSSISDENPALSTKDAKVFHTNVAKLLYLAKRVRPDILTAVAFLTSRVQSPTQEDNKKLERVLKYLNGTRGMGIALRQTLDHPVAYVDASYGVHKDFKSQTGVFITLGQGPVYVASSKQRIIAKSSTEAELVALSDATSQILWTRNFYLHQVGGTRPPPPTTIYEDNMSTIAMIKSGMQNQRTKHINIRYFFLKDRQDAQEVSLRYMETAHMIADIFTKPLQGSRFVYLRAKLLHS